MTNTAKPTRKVTGASLGGALGVLVTYLLAQTGIHLPVEVLPAISTTLAAAGGWLVRELPDVDVATDPSTSEDLTPDVVDPS
jgi:hypothetical protein